nr:YciI family protein [Schlegelella koreensis]
MFYEIAPDGLARVAEHQAGHVARLAEFHARGELLMAGPYGDPPVGALGVFVNRAAAEAFAAGDPFVVHGVVGRHTFEPWHEVLAP